jgi:hypothetical protein
MQHIKKLKSSSSKFNYLIIRHFKIIDSKFVFQGVELNIIDHLLVSNTMKEVNCIILFDSEFTFEVILLLEIYTLFFNYLYCTT